MDRLTSGSSALKSAAPGEGGRRTLIAGSPGLDVATAPLERSKTAFPAIGDGGVAVGAPAMRARPALAGPMAVIAPPVAAGGPAPPAILDSLGIAAVVCTASAQVTFTTAAARALLSRGDAIHLHRQPNGSEILVAGDRHATTRLERAIAAVAATHAEPGPWSSSLAFARARHAMPLIVAIAPFAPAGAATGALLVIGDPDAEDRDLAVRVRAAFGLTPAETRLAVAIARGVCRKAYARSASVKPSTVKTQITNLFAKTGARRESDLVRVLLAVPRLAWPGR